MIAMKGSQIAELGRAIVEGASRDPETPIEVVVLALHAALHIAVRCYSKVAPEEGVKALEANKETLLQYMREHDAHVDTEEAKARH